MHVSDETQPAVGPFQPFVSKRGGPGSGPAWSGQHVHASLHRVRHSASVEEAQAQAAVESLVVLHSIRSILMWTAVIIPTSVFVLLLFLLLAA